MSYVFTATDRRVVFNGEEVYYTQGQTYANSTVEKLPAAYVQQRFDFVDDETAKAVEKVLKSLS